MFNIFKKTSNESINKPRKIEYIIVGLGNPGKKYEVTRHNVGFMAIDYIANQLKIDKFKEKYEALYSPAVIEGKNVLLVKPQTFMNLSGKSVIQFMNYYKIPSDQVIIIFDDISLEPGKLRIRTKGSAGGHNGIKNIILLSNSDLFPRIKIGVGNKPDNWDLANWVTSKFTESDLDKISNSKNNVYESIKLMVTGKISDAMNKFN